MKRTAAADRSNTRRITRASLPNHFAVNETDGGADHPIGLNLKAKPEVKKIFEPVAKILQEIGAGTLNLSEHIGADIEPMEKAGVPAFSPMQDSRFYFNYHHTPADTLDKIVPRELQENAAVVAVAAYAVANASNRCRDESGNPACRVIPSVSRGIPLRIVTLTCSLFKCG